MEAPTRQPIRGPVFIRLLAGVAGLPTQATDRTLLEQLGQWLDWNRAVALSRALDGRTADGGAGEASIGGLADECSRLREAIGDAIADADAWAAATASDETTDAASEYATLRQRYQKLQHSMQAATGRLRGQLRDRLAQGDGGQARLAEIDAVMEGVLSPREHGLLAAVPELLGRQYQRLHASASSDNDAGDAMPAPNRAQAWRQDFRRDLQTLLRAELDLRFAPIDALLEAARTH